jgi:hypothetical protein
MPRVQKKSTTAPKPKAKTHKTVALVDHLNDIAERLRIAGLAVEGAIAACDAGLLGPVQYFISQLAGELETAARGAES